MLVASIIERFDSQIASTVPMDCSAPLLGTLPCVEPYTALFLSSTIGDVNRFPDSKHVTAYLGLVPSLHQSGAVRLTGHMTGVGDRLLRRNMVEGARRAGTKQWKAVHPHCLRKTFEFILRDARKDGTRMDVKTQEFFMGHILPGSQDAYYDSTKVDWMRQEFLQLSFERESSEVKELRAALERKEEMESLAKRQDRFERTMLEALLAGKIPSLTLEVLEKAGYEVLRNPDGSYTLKK